ncbi:hypothetical protein JTB14_032820 [Gonioctena quinquepunctata]|nr:hypothetical protein JTB14_032820 [Gonioctena quinquepunctata]
MKWFEKQIFHIYGGITSTSRLQTSLLKDIAITHSKTNRTFKNIVFSGMKVFKVGNTLIMESCSEKYDLADPKDVGELQRMMFEDDEADLQDDIDDEEDTDGEYVVESREGDSDTEQDASDDDDYDENGSNLDDKNFFWKRKK